MIKHNPGQLLDVVKPVPVTANGHQIGYRLYPGKNSQEFLALGLQSGDIIKAINGMPLTNAQEAMNIFKQLNGASQINVTIVRAGSEQHMTLSLNGH